jgi:DNA-binding NarL/FixJ family response regulator
MNVPLIRVVLADDHAVVRRGIRDFLAETGDISVIAEAENGTQAYDQVSLHRPDVVLLDVQMPGGNGIGVARRLRANGLTVGILMLTAFDDPPYIKAAIEAGANGYVLKSSDADEIIEAIRAVHEGKTAFSAGLTLPQFNQWIAWRQTGPGQRQGPHLLCLWVEILDAWFSPR